MRSTGRTEQTEQADLLVSIPIFKTIFLHNY